MDLGFGFGHYGLTVWRLPGSGFRTFRAQGRARMQKNDGIGSRATVSLRGVAAIAPPFSTPNPHQAGPKA